MTFIGRLLLCMLISLASSSAHAEWHLIQLEELSFTGAKLGAASRDPIAPHYTDKWEYRGNLNMRLNFLGPVYWDNRVHTETAQSGVRTVGWWWMVGLRLHPQLDVFWEHHSRHILDQPNPTEYSYENRSSRNFPVEDSYGVKLNIYEGPKGRSLFK